MVCDTGKFSGFVLLTRDPNDSIPFVLICTWSIVTATKITSIIFYTFHISEYIYSMMITSNYSYLINCKTVFC